MPSLTQRSLHLAEKGKARDDETKKEDDDTDPFIPTYNYDAMKEKSRFNVGMFLCPRCAILLLICAAALCTGLRAAGCRRILQFERARRRVARITLLY
jgi:hypothetical protein